MCDKPYTEVRARVQSHIAAYNQIQNALEKWWQAKEQSGGIGTEGADTSPYTIHAS